MQQKVATERDRARNFLGLTRSDSQPLLAVPFPDIGRRRRHSYSPDNQFEPDHLRLLLLLRREVDKVRQIIYRKESYCFLDPFLNPRTCGRTDAPVARLFCRFFVLVRV